MQRIEIVAARTAHIPAIAEIDRLTMARPWPPAELDSELRRRQARTLVARLVLPAHQEEDHVVAFANYWLVCGELTLHRIATHPAHQRRGYSRALLSRTIADARSGGATSVFLEVSAANRAALALYRQAGFSEVGLRPGYYSDGTDAILMRHCL